MVTHIFLTAFDYPTLRIINRLKGMSLLEGYARCIPRPGLYA